MFDLTPLYRTGVGFDRLAQMLNEQNNFDTPAYPPYNIERTGDDTYRITMAVAGFSVDELEIEVKSNGLTITGKKSDTAEKPEYLHQGIAARSFERRFQLADHVEVTGAEIENGLLHVDLKREIPEAMKPRTIAIKGAKTKARLIEEKAA